jgi:hypothetical protein
MLISIHNFKYQLVIFEALRSPNPCKFSQRVFAWSSFILQRKDSVKQFCAFFFLYNSGAYENSLKKVFERSFYLCFCAFFMRLKFNNSMISSIIAAFAQYQRMFRQSLVTTYFLAYLAPKTKPQLCGWGLKRIDITN